MNTSLKNELIPTQDLTPIEIKEQEVKALTVLAESTKEIATFITGGGLAKMLTGMARTNGINGVVTALVQHGGRQALDARTIKQDAIDAVTRIEEAFKYYQEHIAAKRDPEIKDPEVDFREWLGEKEKE